MNDLKINSLEYWDDRFLTNWESFLGREQTTFFTNLLLDNLPKWLLNEIENSNLEICDAGCAEGEGTYLLSKRFPNSKVVGIDFSIEAIKRAEEYYPEVEFICEDIKNIQQNYNVILCSNVLEHFNNPFEIISKLVENTIKHLIIMIPFREFERIKEHLFTFDYHSIPMEIENYNLTYFREIDCRYIDGTHWSGKQALLIYSNKEILNARNLDLSAFGLGNNNYYESQYIIKEEEIKTLKLEMAKKDDSINWYHQKIEEKDALVQKLTNAFEVSSNEVLNQIQKINEYHVKELLENKKLLDHLNQDLISKNNELEIQGSHLSNILNSRAWRLVRKYYNGRDKIIGLKRKVKKFFYVMKTDGVKDAVNESYFYFTKKVIRKKHISNNTMLKNIYSELKIKNENNQIRGIIVIPSAFEFDELYNQRTINLAKYLAQEGYGVLYIAWQWNKDEILKHSYKCFKENIYQIPLYDFLESELNELNFIKEKIFIPTFPAEQFYELIHPLREFGFSIIYDIMDEWEEFHNVGEASWYKRDIEEAFVLNSDLVICVSEPLKEKFGFIRNDIVVIGNGYNEEVSKMKNIALKSKSKDQMIHIGYFGHLTNSWFDWELVFSILERKDICMHIIGYGASDLIIEKLKEYPNIKFYGKVQPSELYKYVQSWHIGIIPFKESKLSLAVDPIKVYEYLYFGLPTISTGIPHIGRYPLVDYCKNTSDVLNTIDTRYKQILNGEIQQQDLDSFLDKSTWEKRFEIMLRNIKENSFIQDLYEGDQHNV